tara:strand:- start:404 stop:517 length:114 start_codon:yes stop_codon:yes gene_type:complete
MPAATGGKFFFGQCLNLNFFEKAFFNKLVTFGYSTNY